MIQFEQIKVKNFMSFGNAWTEVKLNQGKILVSAQNGSGKQALTTDAISYALFGKPFRKINLPQLINSINQKDCQVELLLKVNGVPFTIKRGMRPAKFEIYQADELIKQEAATKDYQGYLEKNILKINHKTFVQILVLGSAVFTPFMQLPAGLRRQVVEDILDISVFSSMMRLLKEKIQKNKEETALIDVQIDSAKKESISQKKLIETISSKTSEYVESLNEDVKAAKIRRAEIQSQYDLVNEQLQSLLQTLIEFDSSKLEDLTIELSSMKKQMKSSIDKINKISQIDTCPTCMQHVADEHKTSIKTELNRQYNSDKPVYDRLQKEIDDLKSIKEERDRTVVEIQKLKTVIDQLEQKMLFEDKIIIDTIEKIDMHKTNGASDVEVEKEKLRELAQKALSLITRKNELITEKQIQEVSLGLLKDTGIKASIIKEYLPILNKVINKYLTEFEFFINFVLDENFDEKLLSRGRDTASYNSLSEGEKKRIDIAILMAFRHVASMKNSAKVDLLVLDELDSGLDADSRTKLLELVMASEGNVWMISHAIQGTEHAQLFDKIAHIQKRGDFSEISIK